MDPLSIAASVAGLLSLAGSVISTGYELVSKLKTRGDNITALVNEIAAFSGVLVGVNSRVVAAGSNLVPLAQPTGHTIEQAIGACTQSLLDADELFRSLESTNSFKLLLKGDATKYQTEEIIARIEHYKSLFILYLQLESGAQSDALGKSLVEIKGQLQNLHSEQKKLKHDIDTTEAEKKRNDIFQWLGPTTDTEHEDICAQRYPGSGNWLLAREELETWLVSDRSSYLWLKGSQGTGKTFIVSKIIEDIEGFVDGEDQMALVYHYCRFSNAAPLAPERVIGAMLSQLLRRKGHKTPIPQSLIDLHEKYYRKNTYPSILSLSKIFREICHGLSKVFLFIDGLDELSDRKGITQFLQQLENLSLVVKSLVASRAEVDLETAFKFYGAVTVTPADNIGDIEQYVRHRVGQLELREEKEAEELTQILLQKSDGMFLWAVCQLDRLSRVRTTISKELVHGLPDGLEQMFEAGLLKLGKSDRELAVEILCWLMYSRRPLSLEELVEAIAVKPGTENLEQLQKNSLRHLSDVFEICGSYIRQSKLTGHLSLAHYSIYEWLSSKQLPSGRRNQFYLEPYISSILLTRSCAIYLSFEDYGTETFLQKVNDCLATQQGGSDPLILAHSPFLDYALRYWGSHLTDYEDKTPEAALSALGTFFRLEQNFSAWVGIARYLYGEHRYPVGMAPIHAVALHNLRCLGYYAQQSDWFDLHLTTSDGRLPLHIALENDNSKIVDLLIPNQPFLNLSDIQGRCPIHIAVQTGNAKAIALLVSKGADVNVALPDGSTALSMAIENRWDELAHSLAGSSGRGTLSEGKCLLHVAAQSGSLLWTTSLLQFHSSMVHARDFNQWTPLHYAASNGHLKIIDTLVLSGCLVNAPDAEGWTPLHEAIRGRHFLCISRLLKTYIAYPESILSHHSHPRLQSLHQLAGSSSLSRLSSTYTRTSVSERQKFRKTSAPTTLLPGSTSTSESRVSQSSEPLKLILAPSPLLLAVSDEYFEGVQLLLSRIDESGRLGRVSECLKPALELSDTSILDTLLLRANSLEVEIILPDIVAKNFESTKAVLKRIWTKREAHESLRNAVKAGKVGLARFILTTWDLPEKRQLDDLYRGAECSDVYEGKEELLKELLKYTMSCDVRILAAGHYGPHDYARSYYYARNDDYDSNDEFPGHYGDLGRWNSRDTVGNNPAI